MDSAVDTVVVLTGVIAVIISLLTASSSVRQGAFTQLEKVVDRLQKQLDEEEEDRKKLEDQVEKLRQDVKKYQRAFARAILFIRTNLPGEEVPDFMLDTGELKDTTRR